MKEPQWRCLILSSDNKGPPGFVGLKKNDFRVRPSTHTSLLLKWNAGLATILVSGLCASEQSYLLNVRPTLGTMEWIPLKAKLPPVTGHSYASVTDRDTNGICVVSFGGLINETTSEPGTGKDNSYLRMFDVI